MRFLYTFAFFHLPHLHIPLHLYSTVHSEFFMSHFPSQFSSPSPLPLPSTPHKVLFFFPFVELLVLHPYTHSTLISLPQTLTQRNLLLLLSLKSSKVSLVKFSPAKESPNIYEQRLCGLFWVRRGVVIEGRID